MTGSEDAAKCLAVLCRQGRLKVFTLIVVLCICIIVVLATYFVIKIRDSNNNDAASIEAQGSQDISFAIVENLISGFCSNSGTEQMTQGFNYYSDGHVRSFKAPGTSTALTSLSIDPETGTTPTSSTKGLETTEKESKTITATETSTTLTSSSKAPEIGTTPTSTTKGLDTTKKENQTTTAPETSTTLTPSNTAPRINTTPTSSSKAPGTSTTLISSSKAPGTSTTLTPPSKNVTFELSKSYVYIGDNDVQMTCNVSNYYGLTRVEIYQETQRIANIASSNQMVNTSRITLKEGNITNSSAIVRIGFINQVDCWNKGRYYCIVTGYQVSNLTVKLDPLRRPSKPVLILSREIVEGKETRTDLPFVCEGDVGFPAGDLVLDSDFTNNFNPKITSINTTISDETCRAYQKITFSYTFSMNWNGKEILCSAVNNRSLGQNGTPPFDKQLVEVVPATYCQNLPGRQYYHPYNCSKYIDCVNGIVSVGMCPTSLCFGVNETDSCNFCRSSLCVSNVADTICPGSNAEAMHYPGLRCSMYVNCTDRIVHECRGNECFNVNNKTCPSWTQPMTSLPTASNVTTIRTTSTQVPGTSRTTIPSTTVVAFGPSKREVYVGDRDLSMTCNVSNHQHLTRVEISSRLGTIANITQQSTYIYNTGVVVPQGAFVKENNASVKISFTYNLTCNDDGKYDCKAIGNSMTSSSINLTILSEPNVPTLTLSPWIVEKQITLADRTFRCEGMVGKPASQMFVEANISGSFDQYDFPSVISDTEVSCNTIQTYKFSYAFNMSWHGRNIRCAVRNVKTNLIIRSQPKPIEVVPGNYCVSVGTGDDKVYPHPYECGKYIRCFQYKIIGIYECGSGLCFGMNQTLTGGCTYCSDKDLMCLNGSRKPANS